MSARSPAKRKREPSDRVRQPPKWQTPIHSPPKPEPKKPHQSQQPHHQPSPTTLGSTVPNQTTGLIEELDRSRKIWTTCMFSQNPYQLPSKFSTSRAKGTLILDGGISAEYIGDADLVAGPHYFLETRFFSLIVPELSEKNEEETARSLSTSSEKPVDAPIVAPNLRQPGLEIAVGKSPVLDEAPAIGSSSFASLSKSVPDNAAMPDRPSSLEPATLPPLTTEEIVKPPSSTVRRALSEYLTAKLEASSENGISDWPSPGVQPGATHALRPDSLSGFAAAPALGVEGPASVKYFPKPISYGFAQRGEKTPEIVDAATAKPVPLVASPSSAHISSASADTRRSSASLPTFGPISVLSGSAFSISRSPPESSHAVSDKAQPYFTKVAQSPHTSLLDPLSATRTAPTGSLPPSERTLEQWSQMNNFLHMAREQRRDAPLDISALAARHANSAGGPGSSISSPLSAGPSSERAHLYTPPAERLSLDAHRPALELGMLRQHTSLKRDRAEFTSIHPAGAAEKFESGAKPVKRRKSSKVSADPSYRTTASGGNPEREQLLANATTEPTRPRQVRRRKNQPVLVFEFAEAPGKQFLFPKDVIIETETSRTIAGQGFHELKVAVYLPPYRGGRIQPMQGVVLSLRNVPTTLATLMQEVAVDTANVYKKLEKKMSQLQLLGLKPAHYDDIQLAKKLVNTIGRSMGPPAVPRRKADPSSAKSRVAQKTDAGKAGTTTTVPVPKTLNTALPAIAEDEPSSTPVVPLLDFDKEDTPADLPDALAQLSLPSVAMAQQTSQ
ncbi:hypothetical protein HKX48_007665, partial [Thoreauomyces humboldtii]